MSRVLCSRHGLQGFTRASQAVRDRLKTRGEFTRHELVRVSLERIKRSYQVWATQAEVAACVNSAEVADGIVRVKVPREIASFEKVLVYVCPECLNELLVRSGEEPNAPTSRERAFDTAPIAEGAYVDDPLATCRIHGIVFPVTSSPVIASAIETGDPLDASSLVKVIATSRGRESVHWFDSKFITALLGIHADSVLRVDRQADQQAVDSLFDHGKRVCKACLRDLLQRSGIMRQE